MLKLLSFIFVSVASDCGVTTSAVPGKFYPLSWPWVSYENGTIQVAVNDGKHAITSRKNGSLANFPVEETDSKYGQISIINHNSLASVCLGGSETYNSSSQCVLVSDTLTEAVTLTLPDEDTLCEQGIVEKLYADKSDSVAKRLAKRHFCINEINPDFAQSDFVPVFCLSSYVKWEIVGYLGHEFGNTLKDELSTAWLKDILPDVITHVPTIPFDELSSVCCSIVKLENSLPSDGIYTKNVTICDTTPLDAFIDEFKSLHGFEYGFSLKKKVLERLDNQWAVYAVEINFFVYFFILPSTCGIEIMAQYGIIRTNDFFTDKYCVEDETVNGFEYVLNGTRRPFNNTVICLESINEQNNRINSTGTIPWNEPTQVVTQPTSTPEQTSSSFLHTVACLNLLIMILVVC